MTTNPNNRRETETQRAEKKTTFSNGLLVFIGLSALLFAILLGWQSWNYIRLRVEVSLAEEQARTFEEARIKAMETSVTEAAGLLDYIQYYYPSGSKQRVGSHLDRMVELARANASRDIVNYLRLKTGEDLGPKPEAWIKKYAKNK
jgi:hypothetical protein